MRLHYRAAVPADHDFIAASWSGCWGRPREVGFLTRAAWRTAAWASVPTLLASPAVRALVAADADTTDGIADLFGWLVYKPLAVERVVDGYTRTPIYRHAEGGPMPIVFCAFVKRDARRSGIARGLFRAADIDPRAPFVYACHPHDARDLDAIVKAGKIPNAAWCPNLGRLPQGERYGQRTAEDPVDA